MKDKHRRLYSETSTPKKTDHQIHDQINNINQFNININHSLNALKKR